MGYRLLGAHLNSTVSQLPEAIKDWKPPLVVLLDHSDVWHGVKADSPDTIFVGRIFHEFEPDFNDPNLDPIALARDHCNDVLPWARRMGETYDYWQGINEPIIASEEAMKRCAAFDAERARIMDGHGFRVVVGSFSVGNPHLPYWKEFLPALEAARQYGGALALHEYAWPTLDTGGPWYLLRHRKVYDGEPQHDWEGLPDHLKTLPLLITECGLDGLIEKSSEPRGWKELHGDDPQEYLRQLAWYDAELVKDPYVAGAAIYCLATPDSIWASYDIWPGLAKRLAAEAEPLYRLSGWQPSTAPIQPPVKPKPEVVPDEPVLSEKIVWKAKVQYQAGARILAGSLPRAGITVTITDPWGNPSNVISGSKSDYGDGGFEALAPHAGKYKVSFQGHTFQIQTREQATIVTFEMERVPLPPEQPEEPETPELPEQPELPEEPEQPEVPETPEQPDLPEEPEVPELPEQPELPEEPEQPEVPETPEQPELPEEPEQPEEPEVPEQPELPEEPETPELPEQPEEPEQPQQPGGPDPDERLSQALARMDRIIYGLRLHLYGSIGSATMEVSGAIVLQFGTAGGVSASYAPDDPRYPAVLSHLGGLEPGQHKLLPPWPDEQAGIL